jgi:hypothetical protein
MTEFFAIGTAIVAADSAQPINTPATVLNLNDR